MAQIVFKHKDNGKLIVARNEMQARAIKKHGFVEDKKATAERAKKREEKK